MAHIVVMGAGIGGMPAAYELRALLPKEHRVTVVNAIDYFQFTPSNPWLAVGWRDREAVTLPIAPYLQKKGIDFIGKPVTAIDPVGNRLTLDGGQSVAYDYLVITTGPKLSFDEVPGAGPHGGHTHSVCTVDHAESLLQGLPGVPQEPRPGGDRRDAGRQLLRAGLRVLTDPRHRPAPPQAAPQGADHLRDRRAVHRPPGAGRRG